MLERLVLPLWLRLSLALPLLALNLWVLRQLLLPLAPFPALFLGAALIAFLLDLPTRWLVGRSLPRRHRHPQRHQWQGRHPRSHQPHCRRRHRLGRGAVAG